MLRLKTKEELIEYGMNDQYCFRDFEYILNRNIHYHLGTSLPDDIRRSPEISVDKRRGVFYRATVVRDEVVRADVVTTYSFALYEFLITEDPDIDF